MDENPVTRRNFTFANTSKMHTHPTPKQKKRFGILEGIKIHTDLPTLKAKLNKNGPVVSNLYRIKNKNNTPSTAVKIIFNVSPAPTFLAGHPNPALQNPIFKM